LSHPNLPEVYDYFFDSGHPYLVMQYVEGKTLDQLKESRSAPFETDQVLHWANDLLAALIYLHEQDPPIIHRDIKPSNVCITPKDSAILLDFGIARRLSDTSTQTGARARSWFYSPIEQHTAETIGSYDALQRYLEELKAAGIHTGTYSDVYSLGATLYFALTLLDPPDACLRKIEEGLRPVHERNPDVPDFLVEALDRALVVDPRERCQTANELRQLLQPRVAETAPGRLQPRRPRPLPKNSFTTLDLAFIHIPAGDFLMGSNDEELKEACHPQHRIVLQSYCISRCPVTNANYRLFINDNPDYPVPFSPMRFAQRYNWDPQTRTHPRGLEDHPVVLVTWQDALAYCRWLSEATGYRCRLPTEAEWEKAACWDPIVNQVRRYPWGNEFDEARCNVDAHGALRLETSPVARHSPQGDSPYGLADMAGNVWEWSSSFYQPYPYNEKDGREEPGETGVRVVRGGAYDQSPLLARCVWREAVQPGLRSASVGFRVACDAA
jgi:formylglycine-generating enzyme required for sulfatase activity